MSLGETLRARRKSLKLSYRAVGEKAGCSAAFLNDLEFGRRNPKPEMLEKIAKALNCWTIVKDMPCQKCNGSGTIEGKTICFRGKP